jgi:hypothetical protein
MNFKRPYWVLFFISIGCVVSGYASMMLLYTPSSRWWMVVGIGSDLLMLIGAFGFVASLLWMIVAGIISAVYSHQPKH